MSGVGEAHVFGGRRRPQAGPLPTCVADAVRQMLKMDRYWNERETLARLRPERKRQVCRKREREVLEAHSPLACPNCAEPHTIGSHVCL
eukprot:349849-Chlamydomonas_euryale.AAC.6